MIIIDKIASFRYLSPFFEIFSDKIAALVVKNSDKMAAFCSFASFFAIFTHALAINMCQERC